MNGQSTDYKFMLQPVQPQNSMIAVSGNSGQVVTMMNSTTNTLPRPGRPQPTVMMNSFERRSATSPSLFNGCPLWSWLSPTPLDGQLSGHHQLNLLNPFGSGRLGVVSLLLKSLIICVLLNLLLASWIILSLRLHQVN